MTLLIPAKILKNQFDVLAHFYMAQVGGKEYLMRSEAMIFRKGKESTRANSIIVMANPGSCSAVDQNAQFGTFRTKGAEKNFVAARPDQTQYQLMNLMERLEWDCLTIINLSDVCTGNFDEFKKFLKEFTELNYDYHSIFHENRAKELTNHFRCSHNIYLWLGSL